MLTDTVINTVTPKSKPFKLSDQKGLYLLVMPNGSKYFRLDYRFNGKRKTRALGVYPKISLEAARKKAFFTDTVKDLVCTVKKTEYTDTDLKRTTILLKSCIKDTQAATAALKELLKGLGTAKEIAEALKARADCIKAVNDRLIIEKDVLELSKKMRTSGIDISDGEFYPV